VNDMLNGLLSYKFQLHQSKLQNLVMPTWFHQVFFLVEIKICDKKAFLLSSFAFFLWW
jgi:hypothetical protein